MRKTFTYLICLILAVVLLIGCSSYRGGKIKDGVYTNDIYGFKVTPDSDMTYLEDPMDSDDYAVALSYCYLQGGKDSFKAEYALNNPRGGLMVVSEDNVNGFSADDFVESIQDQMKEKIFFTYTTDVNEDVTINGAKFRKFVLNSDGNHQIFLVKATESRILFIYIAVTKNGIKDGLEEKYLNAISGI
ncbi:MAG: hypothetical protein J6W58_01895 [Lachnospiraceae bacterium]|nr:hypothetical protein [Lachnospiraceae bacterium]MBP5745038.1 hypothetical protein [Lachnospiraceae bacterium]